MIGFFRDAFQGWLEGIRLGWWRFRTDALERAIIFVRQGVFFDKHLAKRIFVGDLGEMFSYGEDGLAYVMRGRVEPDAIENEMKEQTPKQARRWRKVYEPAEYNVFDDERVLFVVDGEVVTSPVKGTGKGLDQHSLSNFNRGNAVYQATHSFRVYGKGMAFGGLRLLLIVLAVAIIGFVVYRFVIAPRLGPGEVAPTPAPIVTPAPTPIYSLLESGVLTWR